MDVIATSLAGLLKIPLHPVVDGRGSFVRTFDAAAFAERGLETAWPEHGEAFNPRAGTVRGLHYQRAPHAETKLIRCTRGEVYDVVLDVRPGSATFGQWEAFVLAEDDATALYVPAGFAHGYQTLQPRSTLHYLHSAAYDGGAAAGYRFDSERLAIAWPLAPTVISERDLALPPFDASRSDP